MIASLHPCPTHPEILLRPGEICPKCLRSRRRRPWLIGGILGGLVLVLCMSVWTVYAYRENLFPINLIFGSSTPTVTATLTPSQTSTAYKTETPTRTPYSTRTHALTRTSRPTLIYSPSPLSFTATLPPTYTPTQVPPTLTPTKLPTKPPPPPPPPTDTPEPPEPKEPTNTPVNP